MVITQSAVMVLELTCERWRHRLARLFGRSQRSPMEEMNREDVAILPGSLDLFDVTGRVAQPVERMPAVEVAEATVSGEASVVPPAADPLSVDECKARAAAVRALMHARDGRFAQARRLFAEAAGLDPTLDLSTVPRFWDLPRAAQQAAVEGYEHAGRGDDAMMLAAELAYTFRPKLVRRQPVAAASSSGH